MSDAAARLARSRQAIIEELAQVSQRQAGSGNAGWLARLRSGVTSWWRYHPLRLGLQLVTPLLSRQAGRSPWRFLVVAAAGGALLAIVRPWRLLSVSLLVALAKSSRIPSLLLAGLAAVELPGLKRRGD